MKKKLFYSLCWMISSLVFAQNTPNVVVVLADDIGVGDVSYYRKIHSKNIVVKTPALDKLAEKGMIFTNAHSPAALCAPSRYAVMTGNNCYRSYMPWGVWGSYQKTPYETNNLTLGKLMKNAGYQTAFFGKWGVGMDFYQKGSKTKIYRSQRRKLELDVDVKQIAGNGPKANGFDYSLTFPSGIQNVPYVVYENEKWLPLQKNSIIEVITQKKMDKLNVILDKEEGLGDSYWNPHHLGPLLVNKAIHFIEKSSAEKPFFMYYASLAVHLPHTPAKELNMKKIAGTTPSRHLDKVKELDTQVGMLIEALKKKGVYENTLFIFTSDNGGLRRKNTIAAGHQSNDIFRGGKNSAYEGGHRVPFIAVWPKKIKEKTAIHTPIVTLDILGTLAAVTNQKVKKNQAMDSANLLPLLYGKNKEEVHPFLMLQSGTGREGIIIKDQWKLIIAFDKKDKTDKTRIPIALFNLKDNVEENENKNLVYSRKHKDKVDELFYLYNSTREQGVSTTF